MSDFVVGSDCAGASLEAAGVCGASTSARQPAQTVVTAELLQKRQVLALCWYLSRSLALLRDGKAITAGEVLVCLASQALYALTKPVGEVDSLSEISVGIDELLHSWCYSTNESILDASELAFLPNRFISGL